MILLLIGRLWKVKLLPQTQRRCLPDKVRHSDRKENDDNTLKQRWVFNMVSLNLLSPSCQHDL